MGDARVPPQFPARNELADPTSWTQLVGPLTHLPPLLAELGVDPGCVLERVGLRRGALRDPRGRIPFTLACELVLESARSARCDHLGLLLGSRIGLEDLGLAGQLARHSPTLGEALRTFTVFQQLNAQGSAPYLIEHPQSVQFGWAVFHPEVEHAYPIQEISITVAAGVVRGLMGRDAGLMEVTLPRAAPADPGAYMRHFRCPVRFDAGQATLRFPASNMHHPVQGADRARFQALQAQARGWLDQSFEATVYRSAAILLMKGMPGGDALAQQLAMHRRTLNRRLKTRGTTFQAILDDVRFAYARQLLADTRLTVANIAVTLGYAEASTFSRAFRRWSGRAPVEWRQAGAADYPN
jgi:AraC-like DNA-binding protein